MQESLHFFFSNFMESCRHTELCKDLTYIGGITNGDIKFDSQFIGTSQNTPMPVSDSPPSPPPQVVQKENRAITLV